MSALQCQQGAHLCANSDACYVTFSARTAVDAAVNGILSGSYDIRPHGLTECCEFDEMDLSGVLHSKVSVWSTSAVTGFTKTFYGAPRVSIKTWVTMGDWDVIRATSVEGILTGASFLDKSVDD